MSHVGLRRKPRPGSTDCTLVARTMRRYQAIGYPTVIARQSRGSITEMADTHGVLAGSTMTVSGRKQRTPGRVVKAQRDVSPGPAGSRVAEIPGPPGRAGKPDPGLDLT